MDATGNVHPQAGGMSVAPGWRRLRLHLIPRRLKHLCPGPLDVMISFVGDSGKVKLFGRSLINEDLELHPDAKPDHALVEPVRVMAIADFQNALADTQDDWIVDET